MAENGGESLLHWRPKPRCAQGLVFGPFYGGYNVIALDREYRHALVCGPDRDYLWILSRTPTISDEMKQQMLAIATREGFEVNKLIWVKQPGA